MEDEVKSGAFGEPWFCEEVKCGEPNAGAMLSDEALSDSVFFTDADKAKRAVACVNAMSGIKDPEGFMREVKDRVQAAEYALAESEYPNDNAIAETLRAILSQMEGK